MFAESDVFSSIFIDVEIPPPQDHLTMLVSISRCLNSRPQERNSLNFK